MGRTRRTFCYTHRKGILRGAPHAGVYGPSAMCGMIPKNVDWLVRLYPVLNGDSIA